MYEICLKLTIKTPEHVIAGWEIIENIQNSCLTL